MLELYFLYIALVKGIAATMLFWFFYVSSFFFPHRCALPASAEKKAFAHVAFLSMTMQQVEADQAERKRLLRSAAAQVEAAVAERRGSDKPAAVRIFRGESADSSVLKCESTSKPRKVGWGGRVRFKALRREILAARIAPGQEDG